MSFPQQPMGGQPMPAHGFPGAGRAPGTGALKAAVSITVGWVIFRIAIETVVKILAVVLPGGDADIVSRFLVLGVDALMFALVGLGAFLAGKGRAWPLIPVYLISGLVLLVTVLNVSLNPIILTITIINVVGWLTVMVLWALPATTRGRRARLAAARAASPSFAGHPGYAQPGMGQPGMGQPGYPQPGHPQPGWGQQPGGHPRLGAPAPQPGGWPQQPGNPQQPGQQPPGWTPRQW